MEYVALDSLELLKLSIDWKVLAMEYSLWNIPYETACGTAYRTSHGVYVTEYMLYGMHLEEYTHGIAPHESHGELLQSGRNGS